MSGILLKGGETYTLDHDFAFPERSGAINQFELHLTFDPWWQPQSVVRPVYTAGLLLCQDTCQEKPPPWRRRWMVGQGRTTPIPLTRRPVHGDYRLGTWPDEGHRPESTRIQRTWS
ncbi:MAG TPA: hypothetical protein VMW48_05865 [Vicinamibacterales bacterium]|nr:hypothetical protein [Vicinamibacterales bacterium]